MKDKIHPRGQDKICPVALAMNGKAHYCCRGKCAWWQVYYEGTEKERGECVVKSLAALEDLIFKAS